jgi:uncharacterized damage-inducible protein DinB
MVTKKIDVDVALLLRILDDAYGGKSWHGPNLYGSVRAIPLDEALWRPGHGRHNIAEIVLHAAYWKYAVRRRLRNEKRGSFPLKGSNWFALPEQLTKQAWKDCVRLLDGQHKELREAVAGLSASDLNRRAARSKLDNAKVIYGVAAHDVYHTGQIRLLKAMHAESSRPRRGQGS